MLEAFPDIKELLVSAPIALIVLAFIIVVFKMLINMIVSLFKLMSLFIVMTEKLIEVIKDIKKIELN